MISGIIIPAYNSFNNKNRPAFFKIGIKTFIQHIIDIFTSARITDIVIIVGEEENEIRKILSGRDVKIIRIPDNVNSELPCVQRGLENISHENNHGVMVCPVDHPFINQKILVNLLQGFWKSKKEIIIPACNGQRGHPVIYGAKLFKSIQAVPEDEDLRDLIKIHQDEIHEVAIVDQNVFIRIASEEEYKKYSGVLENA